MNLPIEPAGERDALCGQQLGALRVERVIGTGGMGKVYSARVTSTAHGVDAGRRVALKIVHPHLLETPGFFKRFMREADIGKAVAHGNVVRTYDCDQIDLGGVSRNFLVMEYVEGQTLSELQEELERVPEELCRHIAQEVTKGLAAIHACNVIHRDIKPENVLITPDHEIKVMDLGVARLQDEALRLSMTGHFIGSMKYAAPEQFGSSNDGVSTATDLHALGVLLYELASGQRPYAGENMRQLVHQITMVEPQRLGDLNPQLSPFFEELVHTLLEKKAADRFASAERLHQVLLAGTDSDWWRERERTLRAETSQPLRRIRIPRDTAVYGRGDELARIRKLYDRACVGECQVLLVEGEAGIGKSRLIDEFVGQLRNADEDINFLFGSYPPGGAATSLGAFSTAYREQMGTGGSAALLPNTPLLVPAFDALLKGDSAPADCVPLTKDSLQACFVHATRELAKQRTTIVLIDDLHFAPEEGQALFASLALAVPGHSVLLIGTLRPGQLSDDWIAGLQRLDHVSRLPVPRLGPRDLVRLLGDTFRSTRLAEELCAKISLKSDGNPFFVFEILRGMREGQFITQKADGTWVSTQVIDEIQIPSTVLDLVNARISDLTEEERDLLDVASCSGFEFDPGLIGEVLGLGRIPLLKRFGQIERAHRLVRSSGRMYVFDHHQVQEALYCSLHEQMREEYHRAIAEALESRTNAVDQDPEVLDGALCVDLCDHYLKGQRGEAALRYLPAAQTHLQSGYLHGPLVSLSERALGIPELLTGIPRAKALLTLAGSLDNIGHRARQEECVREAELLAEQAGDDELRARATLALAMCLGAASRNEDARAAFRRAVDIARVLGDKQTEAMATASLASVYFREERFLEMREQIERSLAISREIGNRRAEAMARLSLGTVFRALGRLPESREQHEQSLAISREMKDRQGELAPTGNLGIVFNAEGRLREAREQFEQCLDISREIGNRPSEAISYVNLGENSHRLGDRARAREAFEACLKVCREIGSPYPEGFALLGLGKLADEEGDSSRAIRHMEQSLVLRRKIGQSGGIVDSLTHLGDLHYRSGDIDAAQAALEEAVTLIRELGLAGPLARAEAMLARLPGRDSHAAVKALAEIGDYDDSPELRWSLHQATGERVYLEQAKRVLDKELSAVPEEYHEAMLTNLRVHREIMAAWREQEEGG